LTDHDFNLHGRVCRVKFGEWQKSDFDDSEWCVAEKSPDLAMAVKRNGKITMNGFDISLDRSGKYLRKRASRI
jgi:hypothetical protein